MRFQRGGGETSKHLNAMNLQRECIELAERGIVVKRIRITRGQMELLPAITRRCWGEKLKDLTFIGIPVTIIEGAK